MFKRSLLVAMLATVTAAQAAPLTKDNGAPVGDNQNSITAGPEGPTLLQDVQLVQKLQRFGRERIPERVVHARGTGAYGEFVTTKDLSDLTIASLCVCLPSFMVKVHQKPYVTLMVSPSNSIPRKVTGT